MADAILKSIDSWYNEATQGSDRPKLLSKLAIIELCGWIECELDRVIERAEIGRLNDSSWVQENIIKNNFGFNYTMHFRPMLSKLVGEVHVRKIENRMEKEHPSELENLKSILGQLWKIRCSFAHADVASNVAAQQTFNAPSWSINQHRIFKRLIKHSRVSG